MWTWHNSCTFSMKLNAWIPVAMLVWVSVSQAAEDLRQLSDPTRPHQPGAVPAVRQEMASGPELQSTMISPTFRRATISGRTYKQGDKIDGAVITSIQPYEVTLKRDGQVTRLRLLPKLTKEPNVSAKKPNENG